MSNERKKKEELGPKEYFFLFLFALGFVIWNILIDMGVNIILAFFIGTLPAGIYAFATGILDYFYFL